MGSPEQAYESQAPPSITSFHHGPHRPTPVHGYQPKYDPKESPISSHLTQTHDAQFWVADSGAGYAPASQSSRGTSAAKSYHEHYILPQVPPPHHSSSSMLPALSSISMGPPTSTSSGAMPRHEGSTVGRPIPHMSFSPSVPRAMDRPPPPNVETNGHSMGGILPTVTLRSTHFRRQAGRRSLDTSRVPTSPISINARHMPSADDLAINLARKNVDNPQNRTLVLPSC